MTSDEKASFCAIASFLLAPPEEALLEMLAQDDLRGWLTWHSRRWGAEPNLIEALFEGVGRHDRLDELIDAYERLFDQWNGAAISLVESTYKPWSEENDCGMVFASATGLLMGDSAVHMHDLYRMGGMETPESFRSMPDHLVLELEFLSLLYESASEDKARAFIMDHLDWLEMLTSEIDKAGDPHPFYRSAVRLIVAFIGEELKEGKVDRYGPKKFH